MLPSMQRNPEASPEFHKQSHDSGQIDPFCWASAFLGAAVGIAGPSVFGTLFGNVILWLFISQGRSVQEAYAYIGQYSLSAPMAINLVADVCFALACGWVSVAYGRGARLSQGVVAGLLTVLFPIVMFLNPVGNQMPMLFVAIALGVPVIGSVVGAYLFSRKT